MAKRSSTTVSVVKNVLATVKNDVNKTLNEIEEEGKDMLLEQLTTLRDQLSQKLGNSTLLGKTVYSLFDVIHDKILSKVKTDMVKKYNLSTEFVNDLNRIITEELLVSKQLVVDNVLKTVATEIKKHDIDKK